MASNSRQTGRQDFVAEAHRRAREGRREFFRQAREKLARKDSDADEPSGPEPEESPAEPFEFNAEQIVARTQGRQGWVQEARRRLEQRRWQAPDPIPRGRVERLLLAAERMEDDLDAQLAGNATYEQFRVTGRDTKGRRLGHPPNPLCPASGPGRQSGILTDPRLPQHDGAVPNSQTPGTALDAQRADGRL